MEILLVSGLCSTNKYEWITKVRTTPSLDPAQRMFLAIVEGLHENGCNVTCISALPMGTSNTNAENRYFPRSEECENGVKFIYPAFHIGKFRRLRDLYKNTIVEVKQWLEETTGKKRFILCDSLLAACTQGTRRLAQKKSVKVFAYVTDYPSLATSIKKKNTSLFRKLLQGLYDKFADHDLTKYDGYILVAEALKDLIGIKNKPYLVIEDVIVVPNEEIKIENEKSASFTIVYGGALCERFGVNKLADAVHKISNDNIALHFYGSGESVAYIDALNKKDARICYCGQVSFDELQKIQRSASLLVNPRPSNESFAAYSFPSKTLSYMLSGTPVLTTRIPGIPNSYQPYLLWFDNEDTNSMAKKIEEIVSTPNENLRELGKKAFAYAKTEKNSRAQTLKLLSFAECEIYE